MNPSPHQSHSRSEGQEHQCRDRWQRSGHTSKNQRGYRQRRWQSHKKTPTTIPPSSTSTQASDPQEHPYWQAKDTEYTPPITKNMGAQDKPIPLMTKKPEPASRTLPSIHDPKIANSIYKQSMKTLIMISQRELLSLSLEVRSQYRDCTTTWCIPNKDIPTTRDRLMMKRKLLSPAFQPFLSQKLPIFLMAQ